MSQFENFQVSLTNSRTGIEFGLTPETKYIEAKKDNHLKCLVVVSSKNSSYKPRRNPVEICAIVPLSSKLDGDMEKNLRRGVRKITKHLDEEDVFHLILIHSSMVEVAIENGNSGEKEKFEKTIQEKIVAKKSNPDAKLVLESLSLGYELLKTHGKKETLKRIVLFSNIDWKRKKTIDKKIFDLCEANSDLIGLTTLGFGTSFDETFLSELAFRGRGYYLFAAENVDIPRKISKVMHGVTDTLIARNAHIEIVPSNGLVVTKTTRFSQSTKDEKGNDKIVIYLNDIYKNSIEKVLFDVSVNVKKESVTEFMEFNLRFIPSDVYDPIRYQEVKGQLRLFIKKGNEKYVNNPSKKEKIPEIFEHAKNIAEYAKNEKKTWNLLKKHKFKDACDISRETNRGVSRQFGKDETKHMDMLVKIHSSRNDECRKATKENSELIAKKFHVLSHRMEEDNDFAYFSGTDSDYGNWGDQEEIKSEEEEEESEGEDFEDEDFDDEDLGEDEDEDGEFEDDDFEEDDEEDDEFLIVDDDGFDILAPEPVRESTDGPIVVDALVLIENQQKKIVDVAEALGVSVGVAGNLLKYYQWDNEQLYNHFFEDKEKICQKAGVVISEFPFMQGEGKREMECPICYDDFPAKEMYSLPCKHYFCKNCWQNYIGVMIADGPSCLLMSCPFRGCTTVVDESLVKEISLPKDKEKYNKFLLRSFVDDNPKIKWCPAPDCGKAVYCDSAVENVVCACGEKFCFKCQREAHEPSTCDELSEWKVKERDESETANWMMVHTKICPKCKKAIEKNGGCNHMTCSHCKHEFCWICLDDWSIHGSSTGGYYQCNRFDEAELKKRRNQGKIDDARAALEKYNHYFTRYATHLNSQKFEKELKKKSEDKMRKLQMLHKYSSWSDVEYISKGIDQLCECRRTLKYTYIHAYYIKEGSEKTLFEFLQQDLERETERLSELLEAEVAKFDRDQIIASTKSAGTRLKHLLEGVKEGLVH